MMGRAFKLALYSGVRGALPPHGSSVPLGGDMSNRTNTQGKWAWFGMAVILFGLLMGLRSQFQSEWLRALVAGAAFLVLFGTLNYLRKGKSDSSTQAGSPNGGPAKPNGDSGASGGPPSVT